MPPTEGNVSKQRFTIDGSPALEERLTALCAEVLDGIQRLVPPATIEALVLGGGYGRGQGGVLKNATEDLPYNDLEFYLFLHGNRLFTTRTYGSVLKHLEEELTGQAGLHVEFKIDSLSRFRREPISMFSYDLVSAHRIISGKLDTFRGCEHHLDAAKIPLAEATRLLFNRCSGLLLVRELLSKSSITTQESDFIGRNLAKARLALGDAVLTAFGQYHWSCLERQQRLVRLHSDAEVPRLREIREQHAIGVDFKLHPQAIQKPLAQFAADHRELSSLASQLWLWVESRRLGEAFDSVQQYALHPANKCPGTSVFRNFLLNLKSFGKKSAFAPNAVRYPRERLFNSLPLLLWNGEVSREPKVRRHLQNQLHSDASDWQGLVCAYKNIWPAYG
jgi:hypothetical protein